MWSYARTNDIVLRFADHRRFQSATQPRPAVTPGTTKNLGFGLNALLRGDVSEIIIQPGSYKKIYARQIMLIILGAGSFGAALGFWRDPLQGAYAGIKLPLILLLTAAGNALINGMFAPLLGVDISFRQSFAAVLTSFALAGSILGAFSPLVAFFVWNLPPLHDARLSLSIHNVMLIILFLVIAFAGGTSNLRLLQLLRQIGRSESAARKILSAWLAVNLLLGSQLAWILRPFIGAPGLEVQFLRPNAFQGSFFDTLFDAARSLFS